MACTSRLVISCHTKKVRMLHKIFIIKVWRRIKLGNRHIYTPQISMIHVTLHHCERKGNLRTN